MERKDTGLPRGYAWPVFFARYTIEGRNGVEKGAQFFDQSRFAIRCMVPHDHGMPFGELDFVDTVRFPTRALADTCIGANMDIERARVFLKRELEKGRGARRGGGIVSALAQRVILHQTLTGSVGVGAYSFGLTGLHRWNAVRVLVQADSSAVTLAVAQQISSSAVFHVNSTFAITSGGACEFPVYADLARVTVTATSATPLRVLASGLPGA